MLTNKYLFKFCNRNTRRRCEICSKLTIKTLERSQWRRSFVLLLTLNILHTFFQCCYCWLETNKFLLGIAWNHKFWKPRKVFKLNFHQTSQKQSPAVSNFIKKQLHGRCFNSFMTVVLSYRNHSIDLESKSRDWFLYKRTSAMK